MFLVAALLAACVPREPDRTRIGPELPVSVPRPTRLGVHTRLTDEAEPAKIQRTIEMVGEMGAGWIVEYFPWAYHEPAPGRYEWDHVDQVVETAEQHGLRVLARVDMVPAWARPAESSPKLLTPERFGDYVKFLQAFAGRYEGRIAGLIVGNEPNLAFEWGFRPVDPAEYVELLRQAYPAVKAVAPTTRVVAAGLAPTLEESEQALSELVYLASLYERGAGRYFDALAGHAYGWREPPDSAPAGGTINFRRLELQHQIMASYGDGGKPVLITEAGWNDHPRWTKAVRPSERIAYTLRALDLVEQRWPWAEAICLWAFRLPALAHNYNDAYTLVTPDFQPKPIYDAIRERSPRAWLVSRGRPEPMLR
jgi:hypothetical protein